MQEGVDGVSTSLLTSHWRVFRRRARARLCGLDEAAEHEVSRNPEIGGEGREGVRAL
jgi:hypothetical protein